MRFEGSLVESIWLLSLGDGELGFLSLNATSALLAQMYLTSS